MIIATELNVSATIPIITTDLARVIISVSPVSEELLHIQPPRGSQEGCAVYIAFRSSDIGLLNEGTSTFVALNREIVAKLIIILKPENVKNG